MRSYGPRSAPGRCLRQRSAASLLPACFSPQAPSLHPGALGYGIAGLGLAVSGFFFFLTFMSGLPEQRAAVAVGGMAPDFHSFDSDGREFRLSDLLGSRVLLKFFRGTWCTYCVADLRQWSEQREELRALGLKLVAVSHDSVEELQRFKHGRDWDITFVADPGLEIIRRYNFQPELHAEGRPVP